MDQIARVTRVAQEIAQVAAMEALLMSAKLTLAQLVKFATEVDGTVIGVRQRILARPVMEVDPPWNG